jgi:RNA polymerase sigma factor (sigma-70 family)
VGLLRPFRRPDSLEDVFLERYGDLLRAALAITGARREAEDLVQDAFVRVMLARPDLASIEYPDAYLRTILRNLHTARLRRHSHRAETPLSITDFDSAQFAARALTPAQWTQARHDVAAACRYACTRRLTSKTGSLFLLRFVHELVPIEIARVTRLTRDTVDITLGRARAEVKGYLEQPARALQAVGGELVAMSIPEAEPGGDDDHDADFLARVRDAVFALRHARCIDEAHLQRLYAPAHDTAIPTPMLAEIVTCPHCLDLVSRLTQVPPRAERPPDIQPPSEVSRPPLRLTPRDARDPRRASAEQTCRAVRAHRPRLLRVLVNGFEVATHEISGAATRVTQTVSAMEPVWLVEVYSEQDVCLASLDVTPLPEALAEQRVAVELADDRRIEVALSFLKQWPTLHLAYEDPALAALPSPAAIGAETAEADVLEGGVPEAGVPATGIRKPRMQDWRQAWERWTTVRRPPRLAWWAVTMAVIGWLVFFTPGTPVSAAEWLWRTLTSIVAPETVPAPMPRSGPARQQDITLPAQPKPRGRVSAPSPAALTPETLAELEIDALTVLHTRHALVGQRIQVTRTPSGVAVEGLVEGQNRDELVRVLREVPHGATLRVKLSIPEDLIGTRAGAGAGAGASSAPTLRAITLDRNAVPVADDLRRALASRGGAAAGNVEAELYRLANDGLRNARTAFLEAATLRTLAERFDAVRPAELSDITSRKWHALLTVQADRVARAVDQVRTQLEPLFVPNGESAIPVSGAASMPSAAHTRLAAEQRLGDAARRIAEDLTQVERAARTALAVAETAPVSIELRDVTFWRRLAATADRIAAFRQHVTVR